MNKVGLLVLKKYLLKRIFFRILLVNCAIIGLIPGVSRAADITLGWDANTETDLAGYIVYYGTDSGVYSNNIDVGNNTQHTISNLQNGVTYYLAVSAYDFNNSESDYSAEVVYTIGNTVTTHTITASAGAHGSITPAGPVSVANGAHQSFSISAEQNYQILEVLVDGVSAGAVGSHSFNNVSANHTISASFVAVNQAPVANAG
ncbi:MAG: fibronectin type III domain-containing protein, partial [Desulfobacterales bacterium]|nr:fibronectin type III domain-containing protein [Desulfobacterales bacterium]